MSQRHPYSSTSPGSDRRGNPVRRGALRSAGAVWLSGFLVLIGAFVTTGWAGHFGNRGSVGGIIVDAEGVVRNANVDARLQLRQILLKEVRPVPADLNRPVELRTISLKGLNEAIAVAQRDNLGQLPDEVKYLAGLQRVQYVAAVPEENDIYLIGPAEGWKVDERGAVVGVTTGQPVIQLDDLLVAFRYIERGREESISCSIDPTEEGQRNLQRYLDQVSGRPFNPEIMKGMEQALGPQRVRLTGVPADSHFARVMLAADYHMKRIAMNLDPSPVPGLPGFLDLMKSKRVKLTNMMPRWWLACNYEPLHRSEDGLVWEIRGPGVKAMTEDDAIGADGVAKRTGKQNPVAQQWADMMTERYEDLSKKNAVFGELRNIMDLCVVAAIAHQERLFDRAGCSAPFITDAESTLATFKWPVPKSLATQCSFIKRSNEYVVTASGGVQVDSFTVASRSEVAPQLKDVREKTGLRGDKAWWWN